MSTNILMPALSPTMTEGTLVKWNVKEGDEVRAGDVVAEIETDKATMEVEAVDEGVVGKIVVPEGTEGVAVNSVIAILLEEGEDSSALDDAAVDQEKGPQPTETAEEPDEPEGRESDESPARAKASGGEAPDPTGATSDAKATPLAARMARQAGIDLSGVAGSGPGGKIVKADIEGLRSGSGEPQAASRGKGASATGGNGRIFASPLARRLATEAGIPLEAIEGSGPHGRIVKSDVEKAKKEGVRVPKEVERAASPTAQPAIAPTEQPGLPEYDLVPHSSMRKIIARRLTEAKQTIPHFYLTVDCEVDELVRVRAEMNARAPEGVKLSINDFVIKALALAMRRVPAANASWSEEGLLKYRSVDVSVAVAIEGGLITPVVRNADQKGLAAISAEMRDLAARARDGKLKPEEYQGGTVSISNLGMYGIKQFDAVINPPQSCILAIGASEQRPIVREGKLEVANLMTCTLSCDHRVVDGAIGAELLGAFKSLIEFPAAMLF